MSFHMSKTKEYCFKRLCIFLAQKNVALQTGRLGAMTCCCWTWGASTIAMTVTSPAPSLPMASSVRTKQQCTRQCWRLIKLSSKPSSPVSAGRYFFIHSCVLTSILFFVYLFIHLFVCTFNRLFIHLFIHSIIILSLIGSFVH